MGFGTELSGILKAGQIHTQEPMGRHTSFRTGGAAEYFVQPAPEEAAAVFALCKKWKKPYFVMGNGSNLLVSDDGIPGVVIEFGKQASKIEVDGTVITAQAGALLSGIAAAAARAGLSGMEFAAGIPGTAGGAVVMNGGAYGGEMKDIVKAVTVLSKEGSLVQIPAEALELSYRHSCIPQKGYTVLSVTLQLTRGTEEEIRARMDELREKRVSKQPLDFPSAGSTFKRPEGYFAAKLIEDAGLKGYRVGDAQVSEKHSGFIINLGNATSAQIARLICEVQKKVYEYSGVMLEPEVKFVGTFG